MLSGDSLPANCGKTDGRLCGLTASTVRLAPSIASTLSAVTVSPYFCLSWLRLPSTGSPTLMSEGSAIFASMTPPMMASAITPPPTNAISHPTTSGSLESLARETATRIDSSILSASAIPFPAMSKAVP